MRSLRGSRIALAGALAALAVPAGAAAAHRAALTLTSGHPVTVTGTGFTAHRRVRVTFVSDGRQVRRPRADGAGRFSATFPAVVDRCSIWTVRASQLGRATVILRGGPKPGCTPA